MSFTPVLDLNYERSEVIGTRSFSRQPEVVTTLAKSLLHGMSLAGMSGCGKHFPGHGWATADSHTDMPVDDRELSTILFEDIAPYIALGSLTLASVMPAHVIYSKVDTLPAGFSKIWIHEILRKQLNYQGVIISDDLGMAGAFVAGDIAARARAAISAGCDAALLCNELEDIEILLNEDIGEITSESAHRISGLLPKSLAYTKAELDALPQYQTAVQQISKLL
jgi:beta-N-acetylhexosaminidase